MGATPVDGIKIDEGLIAHKEWSALDVLLGERSGIAVAHKTFPSSSLRGGLAFPSIFKAKSSVGSHRRRCGSLRALRRR